MPYRTILKSNNNLKTCNEKYFRKRSFHKTLIVCRKKKNIETVIMTHVLIDRYEQGYSKAGTNSVQKKYYQKSPNTIKSTIF